MDHLSAYVPQRHQELFHASEAGEKMFLAGVGAGKTLPGVHESAFLAHDNPQSDGCITSPTYPMLRDVILPLWEEWIHPSLYEWKKSDQCFIWRPTNKKIFLRSADRPGRISGLNLGWAWLDEAALLLRPDVWNILRARIRDPRAIRRCLFCTTTPQGLSWLIKEFQKPGERFIKRARTIDNKYLPDDFEPGLRAVYGADYAAQYLDAEILELQGLAWPIIPDVHSSHDLGYMKRQTKEYFGSVDWGHRNPAAILIGGTDGDGRWYLVDEWYKKGQLREDIAREAGKKNKQWSVKRWWIDHDLDGKEYMEREGCSVQLAEKDVIPGVQYVLSQLAVRLDKKPRLHIGAWLTNWHKEVGSYVFPEGNEEPEGADGDHLMDTTRYLLYSHSKTWQGTSGYKTVERSRW